MKGSLLQDKNAILVQPTSSMQAGRQFRFTSQDEIIKSEAIIKEYLEEAISIEKSGAKVHVEKRPELIIPEELQQKFDENNSFREAFFALTPGRQRGYVIYFTQAKQSATRTASYNFV